MAENERLEQLLALPPAKRRRKLGRLSEEERRTLRYHWRLWARDEQVAPGGDWRLWLIMAGRGFGKTRAGAEWVREIAERRPEARIALVAASLGEARAVMVEGESGMLAVSPPGLAPHFEPSLRRLTWPNGAQALLYSAQEPESLRGPQHSHACRAGAERGLRQRGAGDHRRAASLRGGGRGGCAAERAFGRRRLAGRPGADRRVGGTGGAHRLPPGRKLAVRDPARRHARARSRVRAGGPVSRRLASTFRSRGTIRRFGR